MQSVTFDNNYIYINGKKEQIISGAMHYFRIVPQYWEDRLLKLKELGCNCVETYVCWNLHEKRQGEFDFSGWLDFGKFLDIANKMGLYAIVRPGPYICSEWDFGGLPWWILKNPDICIRSSDKRYLDLIAPYLKEVCKILKTRTISNGGNVIFVQLENEYGTYGNDKDYLNWLKAFYENEGIDCGLITSDGEFDFMLNNGTLPDVLSSVNYRTDAEKCIGTLKRLHTNQPGAVMELWNGRAMHWGEKFERRDVEEVKTSVTNALMRSQLLNLYMFHGGTNFGFMNGANDYGDKFVAQMTSYDVDAPLDEYGRRTPKYYAEQEAICSFTGKEICNTAKDVVLRTYDDLKFVDSCSLEKSGIKLKCNHSPYARAMEECDQGYGYIIYEMIIKTSLDNDYITIPVVNDIGQVYIDGEYIKTIYRHDADKTIHFGKKGTYKVSILVENMGRINHGLFMKDRKGIFGDVTLHNPDYGTAPNIIHFGFDIYSLPLEELPKDYSSIPEVNKPAFYKFEFVADKTEDTSLYLDGFTRGVVFINGFNLGRHWDIENSENKLYIPAPLIKTGKNELVIFDVLHKEEQKELFMGER